MAETPCDDHDNTDPNGSNDLPPLVPIMVDGNNTILWLQGPSQSDSLHGVVTGPSFSAEEDKENCSYEAVTTKNSTINNINQTNLLESASRQLDLSGEVQSTTNFNILAMAATAASMVLPTAPSRDFPSSTTPSHQNAPLREIQVNILPLANAEASPLTASTNNESSREDNSCVRAPVSTSNAPYQAATDGAYLSVPESIGLRNIACLNKDAHDLGYDSDGEIGPFFDAVAEEQPFEAYEEEVVGERVPTAPLPVLQAHQNNAAAPPQLSENIIRAMKVAELRNELKSRNKAVSGTKDVLIQRLLSSMNLPHVAAVTVTNDNKSAIESHHGVRWRLLEPDTTPVQEPNRIRSRGSDDTCSRYRSGSKEV
jgi:hypothetical protein